MTPAFDRAVEFVLRWEGGYVEAPDDPGGRTNHGISQRAYPEMDIAGLTREQATDIYRADYWDRLDLDQLPAAVAVVVMDTAVNLGRRRAVQILQQGFNELPGGGHLAVDGRLGPITRRAIGGWCARDPECEVLLSQQLLHRRNRRYTRLAAKPRKLKFLRGWVNRTADLGMVLTGRRAAQIISRACLRAA